jgi:hypothetical protein
LDCIKEEGLFLGPAKVCSVRWRAREDLEAEDHTGDLQGWVEDHVRASPSSSDPGLDVGGNRQEIRARVFPRRRAANRKATPSAAASTASPITDSPPHSTAIHHAKAKGGRRITMTITAAYFYFVRKAKQSRQITGRTSDQARSPTWLNYL